MTKCLQVWTFSHFPVTLKDFLPQIHYQAQSMGQELSENTLSTSFTGGGQSLLQMYPPKIQEQKFKEEKKIHHSPEQIN